MKFIDEVDIELVNQELNFQSQDKNLVIKGGCDLFTTKPIGTDRKLFKTIDKHLDQIMEDNQISQSLERERQHSIHSLFGSSASSSSTMRTVYRGGYANINDRERQEGDSLITFNKGSLSTSCNNNSNITKSLDIGYSFDNINIDESPFGPLKNTTTRKTFAYLIAILNNTYPDHDFSNLQPTTENFHKIASAEDMIYRFNNIMVSLGKKEDLLNWIWDTINVYMDFIPSKLSFAVNGSSSRNNSFPSIDPVARHNIMSPGQSSPSSHNMGYDNCQIFEFQPSDQSILEDLNYPYQPMWSYHWFIYNKKKKRVSFIYLTALNKIHYSTINNRSSTLGDQNKTESKFVKNNKSVGDNFEGDDNQIYIDDYISEDDLNIYNDIVGDIEI